MAKNPFKKRKKKDSRNTRGASQRPRRSARWEDDLSEFSDESNSFYVDEMEERERRAQEYSDDYGDTDYNYHAYEDDLRDPLDSPDPYADLRDPLDDPVDPYDDRRAREAWERSHRDDRRARDNSKKSHHDRRDGGQGRNPAKKKQPVKSQSKQQKPAPRKAAPPKKQKEKRKPMSPTKRKIIRIISYTAIIAVILIVGVVLSLTVLFKTQSYEVTGITKYTEEEIIDACGINMGENIFLAPKTPASNRIKKAFPYVEEAQVGFRIPDTITIAVEEAVEGYLMKQDKTDYLVISTKGRILDKISDPSAYDLPIFIGPTLTSGEIGDYVSYEDDKVVSMIQSITQTFADNGYTGITEIDATDMADISFTYDNRVKVKLGIPEDLDYKIRTAMTIINENLDKNQTGTITGILDVSRCNSTKRSYFNEKAIAPTEVKPSEKPTEAAGDSGDSGGENSGEWSDDSYYNEEYSFYENDDSLYAGEGYYADYGIYEW